MKSSVLKADRELFLKSKISFMQGHPYAFIVKH